ncbi:MAG: SipW-dependent-type signal peptide-containing protein [Thermodesulfovibrionia bacterium]|nr:SipW-dependent-type signal peptide-containing protein [Thermodesulfovibrionia bacterium]
MKKILLSLAIIAAIAGVVVTATTAFFSDTETSTGNTFTAGAIDLKIDNTSYAIDYTIPGYVDPTGALVRSDATSWDLDDLTSQLFFNFEDLKPGDIGEDTVSIHVYNNNAWACVDMELTANDDVTCTEPEEGDDVDCAVPGEGMGELAGELNFVFWADDGDNVLEVGETVLTEGAASDVMQGVRLTIADSVTNNVGGEDGEPLTGEETYYIGKAWCYGALTLDPQCEDDTNPIDRGATGIICDGSVVDNASQTDMIEGTVSFYAEQSRNNDNFVCQVVPD